MISGAVNLMRQAAVTVTILDSNGGPRTTEARIDTGFSGDLTLPKASIEQLGLRLVTRASNYRVGSGAMTAFNAYEGTIRWHSGIRQITVLESEIFPVIGVGLLWENRLSIDFVTGGSVTVAKLPVRDGEV